MVGCWGLGFGRPWESEGDGGSSESGAFFLGTYELATPNSKSWRSQVGKNEEV